MRRTHFLAAVVLALISASVTAAGDPPWVIASLGNTCFRQAERVTALTYSPDAKHIASADRDAIHIWDAADGRRIRSVSIKDHDYFALRYSADGRTLFAAGHDYYSTRLIQIDPTTGKVHSNVAVRARKSEGVISADGGWLVLRPRVEQVQFAPRPDPNSHIHVVNLQTGNDWTDRFGKLEVSAVAFRPDGKVLAVGTAVGAVRIYESASGRCLHDYTTDFVGLEELEFSADGQDLFAVVRDSGPRQVVRFVAATGKVKWSHKTKMARDLKATGDGQHLIFRGADDTEKEEEHWHWLDAATGKPTGTTMDTGINPREVNYYHRFAYSIAWPANEKFLAMGGYDGQIVLWDLSTRRRLPGLTGPSTPVSELHLAGGGTKIRGWSRGWYEWDLKSGSQKRLTSSLEIKPTERYTISRDQKWLAKVSGLHIEFTSIANGSTHRTQYPMAGIGSMQFLPDARLAVWHEGGVTLFDPGTAKLSDHYGAAGGTLRINAHGDTIVRVVRNESLASISRWRLDTGKIVSDWSGAVAGLRDSERGDGAEAFLSPDARLVVLRYTRLPAPNVTEERNFLVEVATGRKVEEFIGTWSDGVTFTPDGRSVLVYHMRPLSYFQYEVATGGYRGQVSFFGRTATEFAFMPDGRKLMVASSPYPVEIWNAIGEAQPWDSRKPADLWEALTAAKAEHAYGAIRHLLGHPEKAAAFLKERMKLPVAPDSAWVKDKLAGLDAPQFRDREKATADLAGAGELVLASMRDARKTGSEEAQARLKALIEKAEVLTPDKLRAIRCCEVLEGLGTSDATALLETWARAAPGTTLVREAQGSLERIKTRDK